MAICICTWTGLVIDYVYRRWCGRLLVAQASDLQARNMAAGGIGPGTIDAIDPDFVILETVGAARLSVRSSSLA